ncbi:MAG: hypothetical protein MJ131_04445 [Lachnospiraceae bacterium]|nr:hypothetical protein [Lachnospiraceae bacterium]
MKQIVCEMCGSNELLKKDGLFCCIACGTKYTVEEARKLFVEGKVEVSGTISIDNSEEYANYKVLAQRARINGDIENTKTWYTKYLGKYPDDWEAYFYSSFLGILSQNRLSAISPSAIPNLIRTTFRSIKQDSNASKSSYKELCKFVTQFNLAADGFKEYQKETGPDKREPYKIYSHQRDIYMQFNIALLNGVMTEFKDYDYANELLHQLSANLHYYKDDPARGEWFLLLDTIRNDIINYGCIPPKQVPKIRFGGLFSF